MGPVGEVPVNPPYRRRIGHDAAQPAIGRLWARLGNGAARPPEDR
jgi:hypothetical protein